MIFNIVNASITGRKYEQMFKPRGGRDILLYIHLSTEYDRTNIVLDISDMIIYMARIKET